MGPVHPLGAARALANAHRVAGHKHRIEFTSSAFLNLNREISRTMPSMESEFGELVNSVWHRIDLGLHLETVMAQLYSTGYFERPFVFDVTYNPTSPIIWSCLVSSHLWAFGGAGTTQ